MSAPDDDTLRAMLAARTPGEWEMRPRMAKDEEYYVEVRGAPGGYLGCRYHDVGGTWEPVADAQLWAAAPALAAEVLRLRAEVLRYHSLRNRLRSCVSDTNVSSAWDRMRSLILQDAASDGGEL